MKFNDWCLYTERQVWTQVHTRGGGQGTTEADAGVMQLRRDVPRVAGNQARSWTRQEGAFPKASRGPPTPRSLTSGLLACERSNVHRFKPPVCGHLLGEPRKTNPSCVKV